MDDVLLRDLLAKYLRSLPYLGWNVVEDEITEAVATELVSVPALFVFPRFDVMIIVRFMWGTVTVNEASTDFFDVPMCAAPAIVTNSLRKCVAKFPAV